MNKNLSNDELGQRLRTEAAERTPAFSPVLHERIMADLKSRPLASPKVHSARRMPWLMPALSAAAIVLLVVGIWSHGKPDEPIAPPPTVPDNSASLFSFGTALTQIPRQLKEAKFGYLDQDASRLTHFVISQLDVLPSAPQSARHAAG